VKNYKHADEAPSCHCGEVFMAESIDSEGSAYRDCALVEHQAECFSSYTHHTAKRCWTPRTAARCECYKGHGSSSGRCNNRNVSTDAETGPILCDRCLAECAK